MGNYVYLDCGEYRVKYMHLSKITVNVGDKLKRGDKVGEIGSTGGSTGPHCHWEIVRISDGESTDPAPTLKKVDKVEWLTVGEVGLQKIDGLWRGTF